MSKTIRNKSRTANLASEKFKKFIKKENIICRGKCSGNGTTCILNINYRSWAWGIQKDGTVLFCCNNEDFEHFISGYDSDHKRSPEKAKEEIKQLIARYKRKGK